MMPVCASEGEFVTEGGTLKAEASRDGDFARTVPHEIQERSTPDRGIWRPIVQEDLCLLRCPADVAPCSSPHLSRHTGSAFQDTNVPGKSQEKRERRESDRGELTPVQPHFLYRYAPGRSRAVVPS